MISGFVKTIDLKPTAHCYAGSLEFQILAKWRTQSQTVERKKKKHRQQMISVKESSQVFKQYSRNTVFVLYQYQDVLSFIAVFPKVRYAYP